MPLWKRSEHHHHYRDHRVGAGLVRRLCEDCGEVHIRRNAWPILRWMTRGERPGLFSSMGTMIFSAARVLADHSPTPRFGERRR